MRVFVSGPKSGSNPSAPTILKHRYFRRYKPFRPRICFFPLHACSRFCSGHRLLVPLRGFPKGLLRKFLTQFADPVPQECKTATLLNLFRRVLSNSRRPPDQLRLLAGLRCLPWQRWSGNSNRRSRSRLGYDRGFRPQSGRSVHLRWRFQLE